MAGFFCAAIVYLVLFKLSGNFVESDQTKLPRHFLTLVGVLFCFFLPLYWQVQESLSLLSRQGSYNLLYCWLNPFEIAAGILRGYVVTLVLFRVTLVPTFAVLLLASVFLAYGAVDFV